MDLWWLEAVYCMTEWSSNLSCPSEVLAEIFLKSENIENNIDFEF